MSNWSDIQQNSKDRKERDRTRREKMAGYFLNLSQLTFAALVLGGITPLYEHSTEATYWAIVPAGAILTYILARIGYSILN